MKNIRHKLCADADSPTYIFNRPRVGYLMPRGETRQFTRAMDELGIQMVFARSPQGKGRVERMTFQDRLISELRLAGATTIPDDCKATRVRGSGHPVGLLARSAR